MDRRGGHNGKQGRFAFGPLQAPDQQEQDRHLPDHPRCEDSIERGPQECGQRGQEGQHGQRFRRPVRS